MSSLYSSHLTALADNYAAAFEELADNLPGLEALLIHSGSEHFYFGDDRGISFQAYGHFLHWLPVNRPDQFLLIRPRRKPCYLQFIPSDFWYEQTIDNQGWWADCWDIRRVDSLDAVVAEMAGITGLGFIGENSGFAQRLGIDPALINPPALLHHLDYFRAYKTPYEVEQLLAANAKALAGHAVARNEFLNGGSEYAIHMAYLQACQILEEECPYTNIVALDQKSAILHYQYKRRNSGDAHGRRSQVLLLDAGCRVNGYGSDVTRTSVRPHTLPLFASLVAGMDSLQLELAAQVRPGLDYRDFHALAIAGVGRLLVQHGILHGSEESVLEQSLPTLFFPHGVGHLLGIQVHDVGGRQRDASGTLLAPPANAPALRNTRIIEEHMVFTVEPGLYFIPSLLDPERNSARGRQINWDLAGQLLPLGGIRIEDNLLVTASGSRNLTRVTA